jgi:hypothetical protein
VVISTRNSFMALLLFYGERPGDAGDVGSGSRFVMVRYRSDGGALARSGHGYAVGQAVAGERV